MKSPVKRLIAILLLLESGLLLASPSLTLAKSFKVLAINGVIASTEQSYQAANKNDTVSLRSGINRIIIRYEETYDKQQNSHNQTVYSSPLLLSIYLNKSGHYQQVSIKPMNYKAAIRYAKNPVFNIIEFNRQGRRIETSFQVKKLTGASRKELIKQSKPKSSKTLKLSAPSPDGVTDNRKGNLNL